MARSLGAVCAAFCLGIAALVAMPATALVPVGASFPLGPGGRRDAAWSNGLLYTTSDSGFQIVDVGHPDAGYTIVAGQPGSFRALAVSAPFAYLVGPSGLSIVDVSDPAAPAWVGALPLTGKPLEVALAGTRAYVVVEPLGLRIVDVARPTAPILLGSLDLEAEPLPPQLLPFGSPACVSVERGFAYFFSRRGLEVLDVRNPSAPRPVASLDLVPGFHGAETVVHAGFLYATGRDAAGDDRVQIFDLRNPAAPRSVGVASPDSYFHIALDRNTLYADNGLDFHAFDVRDAAHVVPLGVLASPANAALTLEATAGFVVGGGVAHFLVVPLFGPPTATLRSVSLAVPDAPRRTRRPTVKDDAGYEAMAVDGDLLFGVYEDRFDVNSIASPLDPVLIGSVRLPGFPYDIAIADEIAYVASETNLAIVSVADPRAPVLLQTLEIEATAVARAGDRLYVGTEDGELEIFDIADRTRPAELSELDVALPIDQVPLELNAYEVYDLELAGDVLYVATLIGVRTVDISNPAAPVSIGTFSIPASSYLRNMALSGSLLFVGGIGGARIIDASDPANLREIKKFTNFGLYDLQVVGSRLILSGIVINVYDVSQPSEPRAIGGVLEGGGALAIVDGIAYAGSVAFDTPLITIEFGPEYDLAIHAEIDIAPRNPLNTVNTATKHYMTVALLGSDELDVDDVAAGSLAFGPGSAPALRVVTADVNHDRRDDLLALFSVAAAGLDQDRTSACLSGTTTDGRYFGACDALRKPKRDWRYSRLWHGGVPWCTRGAACWRGTGAADAPGARR